MAEATTTNARASASDATHARIEQAAERVKQQTRNATEAAQDKVDAVAGRAEQRAEQVADAGVHAAHRAADAAADWRECGAAAVHDARDRADDVLDKANEWMRERPVQSLAIALAAGWLIGRLLSSRR